MQLREDAGTEARLGVGATITPEGVHYRVFADQHAAVRVEIARRAGTRLELDLQRDPEGYFSGVDELGQPGDRYRFRLSGKDAFPDPASRFQPEGVHGVSEVVDPSRYSWRSEGWKRPAWKGQTIYEIHVGTFTEDGTFRSAINRLDHLVDLGIEAVEIMPVADFGGDRNWGYDGVALYAPARCYGRPDDFRAFVDAAHERGLMVILDVVYNHTGPNGNYLSQYSEHYYHPTHRTPWGHGFNFDGAQSAPVREFFIGNAAYWLDEYRIDGLRLDATHAIEDESPRHLLTEIADAVHARGGFLVAEDERNSCAVLSDEQGGGHGIDAVWSDDFHHQVRVALTQVQESYFASYSGDPDALAVTLDHGWYYTGQGFPFWKGRPRGTPCRHLDPSAFVYCIENHDQVGNRALGERLEHIVPEPLFRAASALLCLSPYVPLVFMGQEWAAGTPFLYFTNHGGDLGRAVSEGRRREFAEAGLNSAIAAEQIPDPEELATFVRSKLDWREPSAPPHRNVLALYQACLRARRQWIRPALGRREHFSTSVAGPAVVIRYEPEGRRAVLVLVALKEGKIRKRDDFPALNPPEGQRWSPLLQTESAEFGGLGGLGGSALSSEDAGAWLTWSVPAAACFIAEDL